MTWTALKKSSGNSGKLRHSHLVSTVELSGKASSILISCWCGKEIEVATWATRLPRGWGQQQWPLVKLAGMALIDAKFLHDRARRSTRMSALPK